MQMRYLPYPSNHAYFHLSHSLNPFCFCLVFHPSLALMLLIQSSLLRPSACTDANGYLLALTVT